MVLLNNVYNEKNITSYIYCAFPLFLRQWDMGENKNPLFGTWEWSSDDYIERFKVSNNYECTFYFEDSLMAHTPANPSTDSGTINIQTHKLFLNGKKWGLYLQIIYLIVMI